MKEIFHADFAAGSEKIDADPVSEAIEAFRAGFADYNANAPIDDEEACRAYAETSYRRPRKVIVEWILPAITSDGAVKALRLAQDGIESDDYAIVTPMVTAALRYLETLRFTPAALT